MAPKMRIPKIKIPKALKVKDPYAEAMKLLKPSTPKHYKTHYVTKFFKFLKPR